MNSAWEVGGVGDNNLTVTASVHRDKIDPLTTTATTSAAITTTTAAAAIIVT